MQLKRHKKSLSLFAALILAALQFHGVLHAAGKATHADSPGCQVCVSALSPAILSPDAAPVLRQTLGIELPSYYLSASSPLRFCGASLLLRGPPASL
ncbi:MAG: hypothetical protein V4498_07950 [candidate division FCPU426 bacterium]